MQIATRIPKVHVLIYGRKNLCDNEKKNSQKNRGTVNGYREEGIWIKKSLFKKFIKL